MTRYLAGIHDREGARHVPAGGWVLDTIALNDRPHAFDYARFEGVEWIVRANFGYGSTGTIPLPGRYAEFADLCADYVRQSRGVTRWIIGNEPNHSQERPDGQPITPESYALCFNLCRQAIHAAQPSAQVIPAPVAPWNVETGDWLDYWQTVLAGINGCEGLAIHSYIHEADANLVNSDAKMAPPFQDRHFQFAAYRDMLARVPDRLRHLPVYLTEANPLSGWQARGIIPAMLDHVHAWNQQPATQRIQCVIFYRYPPFDRWSMSDKAAVMDEFRQHAQRHTSPAVQPPIAPAPPAPTPPTPPAPVQPVTPLPVRLIDESFFKRVPGVKLSDGQPGRTHYRLVRAEYVEDGARRFGPDHHVLVDVLDRDGNRKLQTPVAFWWADGQEVRNTDKPSEPYAVDYAMYAAGHSYGVRVAERDATSDEAFGMGLGKLGNERQGDHVSYFLIFRETLPVVPLVPRPQPGESGQTLYVNAPGEGLIVRAGPGMQYERVDGLAHGTPVTIYEVTPIEPYWARTDIGWLARWLLIETPPAPVIPPVVTPPPVVEPMPPSQPPPAGIIDPLAGQAIIQIESGGQGFGPGNRLLIRFENHLFNRQTNNAYTQLFQHGDPPWTGHQWRRSTSEAWQTVHTGNQANEWMAFEFASSLNRHAALQSISMGAPQVLGSHFRRLGYATPEAMFRAFGDVRYGMAAQMLGFVNFFLSDARLFEAMRNKDFLTVATIYNGPGQAQHYANLMRQAYERLR